MPGDSLHVLRGDWALLAVFVLVLSACSGGEADTTTTTTTTAPTTTSTTLSDPALDGPVFSVALTSGLTTTNWWAALDAASTPENRAVLGHTKTSMFQLTRPGFAHVPVLAAMSQPAPATQEGSSWVVAQELRDGVFWSDGVPVTAGDLEFYFDVVRDFDLGGEHAASFSPSVSDVTAVDDLTIRVEFDREPSLTDWQTGVAMAPFVPSHFWEPHVEDARSALSDSARRNSLYSFDGAGEPSAGPLIFESWSDGVAITSSNPDYHARGTETTVYSDGSVRVAHPDVGDEVYGGSASGVVEDHHIVGPFVSAVRWQSYDSETAAYDALKSGEVDFVDDPDGMSLTSYNDLATREDIGISISQAEGFRFLAFNLRKPPMSDPVFRQAVAIVIDKELVSSSLFGGTLFPAHTLTHPGLRVFDATEISRPGWSAGGPMSEADRFETAIALLADAGYTWDEEPQVVRGAAGDFIDVIPGVGLEMPNGVDVPALEIVAAPVSGDDPMRATFALWIESWLADLGIEVSAETTNLSSVADDAFEADSPEATLSWDMHVLGWGGADPALPGLTLVALFHSQNSVEAGGLNTTGYASAEFDAAADAFVAADSMDEAARHTTEMERIIAADLPYVTLFRPPVIEGFGSNVEFPVESLIGGHGGLAGGWPASVRITSTGS